MRVIIDGYNAINKLAEFRRLLPDLEKAREGFSGFCAEYGKARKCKVTIVYDGVGGSWGQEQKSSRPGVGEIFTARGEKADPVIIRIARESPSDAVVVTEDRDVATQCRHAGAAVLTPFEFADLATKAIYESGDEFGRSDDDELDAPREKKGQGKKPGKAERRELKVKKKL